MSSSSSNQGTFRTRQVPVFLMIAGIALNGVLFFALSAGSKQLSSFRTASHDSVPSFIVRKSTNATYRTQQDLNFIFHRFFENREIVRFKENFISHCVPGRAVLGGLMHGNGYQVGFGSMLNHALNAYVIAVQPEVNRTFQLVHFRWPYTELNRLFVDFAEQSNCPIFRVISGRGRVRLKSSTHQFTVALNTGSHQINLTAPRSALLMFATPQTIQVQETVRALRMERGTEQQKGKFLRAMWNPQPELKSLIQNLWFHLVNQSSNYFGVHIRRGDKIRTGEAVGIPVQNYSLHLEDWCTTLQQDCPKTVFVSSDEPETVDELRKALEVSQVTRFTVFGVRDLLVLSGLDVKEYMVPLQSKSPQLLAYMPKEAWDRHTNELVVTLTLLALSDYLLCTFSSNMCRLLKLFRLDEAGDRLHSLDSLHELKKT